MVQKSGGHQLRLVVYPIIYKVLAPSQVVQMNIFSARSLTVSLPLKNDGKGSDDAASYWVSVTFQGRTVKLREGN